MSTNYVWPLTWFWKISISPLNSRSYINYSPLTCGLVPIYWSEWRPATSEKTAKENTLNIIFPGKAVAKLCILD